MKKTLYILLCFLTITSCNQEKKTNNTNTLSSIKTSLFLIKGLNIEDFKIDKTKDSVFYTKKSYEGLDGKVIELKKTELKNIQAKIQYEFSFLQYTIDDNPAYPISYSKDSKWSNLPCKNNQIIIPDFRGKTNSRRVHKQLGYNKFKQITTWLEKENFKQIRLESFNEQKVFFEKLIQNKSEYINCCPEYIKQANNFLETKIDNYKSINDLRLELYIKKVVINISGHLNNGKEVRKVIILN